eukprot:g1758.t1
MDCKVLVYAQELRMGLNDSSRNMQTTNKIFTIFLFIICIYFISLYLVSKIIENQRKLHKDKAGILAEGVGVGSNSKFAKDVRVQVHKTIEQHKVQHLQAPKTNTLPTTLRRPQKEGSSLKGKTVLPVRGKPAPTNRKHSSKPWPPIKIPSPRGKDQILIIDAFTFNFELDLLEIRLNELKHSVDYHILVESAFDLYGKPKPMYFDEHKWEKRFLKFRNKIIYVPLKDWHYNSTGCALGFRHFDYMRRQFVSPGLDMV